MASSLRWKAPGGEPKCCLGKSVSKSSGLVTKKKLSNKRRTERLDNDAPPTRTPGTSTADTKHQGALNATLKDLCSEDKSRVRQLIEQLAQAGLEKEQLEDQIKADRAQFSQLLDQLKVEHLQIVREKNSIVEELLSSQTQLRLLQATQHERESAPAHLMHSHSCEINNHDQPSPVKNNPLSSICQNNERRNTSVVTDDWCSLKSSHPASPVLINQVSVQSPHTNRNYNEMSTQTMSTVCQGTQTIPPDQSRDHNPPSPHPQQDDQSHVKTTSSSSDTSETKPEALKLPDSETTVPSEDVETPSITSGVDDSATPVQSLLASALINAQQTLAAIESLHADRCSLHSVYTQSKPVNRTSTQTKGTSHEVLMGGNRSICCQLPSPEKDLTLSLNSGKIKNKQFSDNGSLAHQLRSFSDRPANEVKSEMISSELRLGKRNSKLSRKQGFVCASTPFLKKDSSREHRTMLESGDDLNWVSEILESADSLSVKPKYQRYSSSSQSNASSAENSDSEIIEDLFYVY